MSPDFNYSEVPNIFLHCLNKQCKHSAKCMRYLVTAYVPDNYPVISTVNPNYFSSHKESCPYRKERLLKPKEQEYIRQLFLKRGIKEEPVYDEYVEQYEW